MNGLILKSIRILMTKKARKKNFPFEKAYLQNHDYYLLFTLDSPLSLG